MGRKFDFLFVVYLCGLVQGMPNAPSLSLLSASHNIGRTTGLLWSRIHVTLEEHFCPNIYNKYIQNEVDVAAVALCIITGVSWHSGRLQSGRDRYPGSGNTGSHERLRQTGPDHDLGEYLCPPDKLFSRYLVVASTGEIKKKKMWVNVMTMSICTTYLIASHSSPLVCTLFTSD